MNKFYRKFFAIVLIAAGWILLLLNTIIDIPLYDFTFVIFFVLTIFNFMFNPHYKEKGKINKLLYINKIFEYYGKFAYVLLISTSLLYLISFGILITIFIYGGGPEIIDSQYYIVSHGNIVRTISISEYNILSMLEKQLKISGPACVFSATLLQLCNDKNN